MRTLIASCLVLLSSFASASGGFNLYVVGDAFDDTGNTLLYREVHRCDGAKTQCVIDYLDPAEARLARKALDYRNSPHAPDVELENLLANVTKSASGSANENQLVIDAGFDNYVRTRWYDLDSGEAVTFPFLMLGRDDPLEMRAVRSEEVCAEEALCLEVAPEAWFLRLLVPPIELTYERETRRLLRYRGIGNLRDAEGNSPQVDIRYRYTPVSGDVAYSEAQPIITE